MTHSHHHHSQQSHQAHSHGHGQQNPHGHVTPNGPPSIPPLDHHHHHHHLLAPFTLGSRSLNNTSSSGLVSVSSSTSSVLSVGSPGSIPHSNGSANSSLSLHTSPPNPPLHGINGGSSNNQGHGPLLPSGTHMHSPVGGNSWSLLPSSAAAAAHLSLQATAQHLFQSAVAAGQHSTLLDSNHFAPVVTNPLFVHHSTSLLQILMAAERCQVDSTTNKFSYLFPTCRI